MRKQVDFDTRVFPLGNGANDSMTHEQVGAYIRENYLKQNWEVLSTDNIQVSAGTIYFQVSLVKYEDLVGEVSVASSSEEPNGPKVKSGDVKPK